MWTTYIVDQFYGTEKINEFPYNHPYSQKCKTETIYGKCKLFDKLDEEKQLPFKTVARYIEEYVKTKDEKYLQHSTIKKFLNENPNALDFFEAMVNFDDTNATHIWLREHVYYNCRENFVKIYKKEQTLPVPNEEYMFFFKNKGLCAMVERGFFNPMK